MEELIKNDVTQLLAKWSDGDKAALEEVISVVYEELRKCAKQFLKHETPNHTLQPTALVNEVYIRLTKQKNFRWQNRVQFFSVASKMMRRILVDYARSKNAGKRWGNQLRITFGEIVGKTQKDMDLITLDKALEKLTILDLRQSQIVELRFFGGLSVEETAEVLDLSIATIMREWKIAKMWLYRELQKTI